MIKPVECRQTTSELVPLSDPMCGELPKLLPKSQGGSDRFIPFRQQTNYELFRMPQQDQNNPPSQSSSRLNKLYKKYVLNQQSGLRKDNNILQFGQQRRQNYLDLRGIEVESTTSMISKTPFKVLDAPALQDDFYLNLIDWSSQNILSVGLGSSVYLWAPGGKVVKLCQSQGNSISSVGWSKNSSYLGIGTNSGQVQIWDVKKMAKIRTVFGHSSRSCSIAWANSQIFSTGSRDNTILNRDLRVQDHYYQKLIGHKQEVCGLKWSGDQQQLCSGGNDNKLFVWSNKSSNHLFKFSDHVAAVKALAWSPHQHGMIASGGGTADRTIRFWNTLEGRLLKTVDTGSQVCNLVFSKNSRQLVSTHGYSNNQICIWDRNMKRNSVLTGHTYRVLYLAINPEGTDIVTGAGDETLRFWKIFQSKKTAARQSALSLSSQYLR